MLGQSILLALAVEIRWLEFFVLLDVTLQRTLVALACVMLVSKIIGALLALNDTLVDK